MTVLAGLGAGKTARGIAEDIWGEEDVAATWTSDSWMRSQVRRWVPKAEALADGGWREFVLRGLAGGDREARSAGGGNRRSRYGP